MIVFRHVIIIILDACGVGALPDAVRYGDSESSTIPHVAASLGGLKIPNLEAMGLGNIASITGVPPSAQPKACFGKMAELSPGKDSTTGHWEIGGVILNKPFPLYPDGFPEQLVIEFEKRASVKTIGNYPASGTEIIKELGERHMTTGEIILYTSADSVFQLAAHEEIVLLPRLYEICRIARELLRGEHAVGRVIARPFVGEPGHFVRTVNRKDFSLDPPSETILDVMMKRQIPTIAIGKIADLFAHRGISREVKAKNNREVIDKVIDEMSQTAYGLIFANLVDFDMLWGHRNDTKSFGEGLEYFDERLPQILGGMRNEDLLIITADHGCDPTLKYSTDHTREYVPLLVYGSRLKRGIDLCLRETFSDVARTLAEIFALDYTFPGKSFLSEIEEAII